MKLRHIDLRLLTVFEALMEERNVTRASRRLGMSQPAVSNTLARLRTALGDDLFLRGADGMRPTRRALELAVPVADALRRLQAAVEPSNFIASEAKRTYRLGMSPQAAAVILPPLIARLRTIAPGIELHIHPKTNVNSVAMLDSNDVDFVIGVGSFGASRIASVDLFEDSFVCLMRRDHPLAHKKLTLSSFVKADHLLVSPTGALSSLLDASLEKKNLRRNIGLVVNQYDTAAAIIAKTDFVGATYGSMARLSESFAANNLIVRPLPLPRVHFTMCWHRGLTNHAAYDWLRDQIIEICLPFRASSRNPHSFK